MSILTESPPRRMTVFANLEKSCYVPRCKGKDMDMVKIESWDDFLALPKNNWNIPEPTQDQIRENGRKAKSRV
ncbi:hypothetical protein BGW38_008611, partial [Lunasporangiospora selenospora]